MDTIERELERLRQECMKLGLECDWMNRQIVEKRAVEINDGRVVKVLCVLLKKGNPDSRWWAAEVLGNIGRREILPALKTRLRLLTGERNKDVRAAIRVAIRKIEKATAETATLPLPANAAKPDVGKLPRVTETPTFDVDKLPRSVEGATLSKHGQRTTQRQTQETKPSRILNTTPFVLFLCLIASFFSPVGCARAVRLLDDVGKCKYRWCLRKAETDVVYTHRDRLGLHQAICPPHYPLAYGVWYANGGDCGHERVYGFCRVHANNAPYRIERTESRDIFWCVFFFIGFAFVCAWFQEIPSRYLEATIELIGSETREAQRSILKEIWGIAVQSIVLLNVSVWLMCVGLEFTTYVP